MNNESKKNKLATIINSGLVGYQPFFLENGVVLGTGLQFFAAGEKRLDKILSKASDLPNADLGNIYIPKDLLASIKLPASDFYTQVSEENKERFIHDNRLLLRLYQHLVEAAFLKLKERSITIESFIELGGNTGLFGSIALEHVNKAINVDIVDYGEAMKLLAELCGTKSPEFYHLKTLRSQDIHEIPVCDLGWSYAVAIHQSNPLIHICDLSSVSRKSCLFMTTIGMPGEIDQNSLTLQFKSSNTYYSAKFPNNFDVTLMSDQLIRFSLEQVGFDEILEIPFPEFVPIKWAEQHKCYLGIRNKAGAPSIYEFARSVERDGSLSVDNESITLSFQGSHSNIISYRGGYYIIPHGMPASEEFFMQSKKIASVNEAHNMLDDIKEPRIIPR